MRARATAEPSETFARGVARDPYTLYEVLRDAGPVVWSDELLGGADNPAFRGLRSLRLTRVVPAGMTPEDLVESKTRAGAKEGTGSWSTAG